MTLYLVYYEYYDIEKHWELKAIFDTKEKALDYIKGNDDMFIDVATLNEEV